MEIRVVERWLAPNLDYEPAEPVAEATAALANG
jgi:hypothetical protein